MRWIALCFILLAAPALAQDDQDEPGFFERLFGTDSADDDTEQGTMLERLIQDKLSGDGRIVTVTGFRGALSSRATLESLTISDADGAWLTMTDAELDWSRAALLRGRLQISQISAREILLPRLPASEHAEAPTPEAGTFQLPELPVSVNIDQIAAERVELGEALFGVESVISLEGSASLADGEGIVDLEVLRRDQPGQIRLFADYRNDTDVLQLDLSMQEGEGGILATLAGLPGAPSVDFTVQGEAPLSDFTGEISLATDGQERLAGEITLGKTEDARHIAARIEGDIAPVFAPQFEDFFGNAVSLEADSYLRSDGRVEVPNFALFARELSLFGSVSLGADKMPEVIDITGRVAPEDDETVLLPLAGAPTTVSRANLAIQYDASQSEDYVAVIRLADFAREGMEADRMALRATGRIGSTRPPEVSGDIEFEVAGLDTSDGLSDALGPDLSGIAALNWAAGGPVTINRFTLDALDLHAQGAATIGKDIRVTASLEAGRLENFAEIADRSLSGQATLETEATYNPLTGAFDIAAKGQTIDLAIGDDRTDAILAGAAELDVEAVRDTEGLRITLTTLESDAASLTGAASLRSGGSTASLEGRLLQTERVLPGVIGPSEITFSGQESDTRDWTIATMLNAPALNARIEGLLSNIYDLPAFQGSIEAESPDISTFSEAAGRPLSGNLALDLEGGANADLTRILIDGTIRSRNLSISDARFDPLLQGNVAITARGGRTDDRVDIETLVVQGDVLTANVSGTVTDLTGTPAFDGSVTAATPDLGIFSALAGRTLTGSIDLTATGAARSDLSEARIAASASAQNLSIGDERFDPLLQGDLALQVNANRNGDRAEIENLDLQGDTLTANLTGTVTDLSDNPTFEGTVSAASPDLGVFSGLAQRPLSGSLDLSATGAASADLALARIDGEATGQDLSVGIAELDRLLAGPLSLTVDAGRDGNAIEVDAFSFETNALTAETSGRLGEDGDLLKVTARLNDVAPFVPGFSGALSVDGTLGRSGDNIAVDLDATGPGGSQASVDGTVAQDFSTTDLSVNGTAPLALANRFISPRSITGTSRFDLRMSGPPALESLSGQATLSGGRFADPGLPTALENIGGTINLSGGSASLNIDANVESGGRINVSGPVGLTAPNSATLRIGIDRVRIIDPQLYETVFDGQIGIDGPLAGGASIAGNIDLGETNIRIPSSGLGGAGPIPEVVHINEPPPVRETRRKAGLLDQDANGGRSTGPVYGLDVRVSAPNRVFVRGRGLDSEFGGTIRITGTTANIVPIGSFQLIRGRLDILGNRLDLDSAQITLQGSLIPFLNIRAATSVDDTDVNVEVFGPADNPELDFSSSPELPQEEVLALLIFGRDLESLSALQAARLAIAVRTLAGRGGEGLVENIRGNSGLADLDVTTDEDGNAAVRAGGYLTENVYTDVTVDSEGDTQLNINLDVTPSLTVRGGVTNEGDSSIGLFFERDY